MTEPLPKPRSRKHDGTPAWRAHEHQVPLVVEDPGFVELSEADRREAVAAFTDILAAWWQRHTDTEPASPSPDLGDDPDGGGLPDTSAASK